MTYIFRPVRTHETVKQWKIVITWGIKAIIQKMAYSTQIVYTSLEVNFAQIVKNDLWPLRSTLASEAKIKSLKGSYS